MRMVEYRCDICETKNNVGGDCPECGEKMKCTTCWNDFDGYYCTHPKMKTYSDMDCPDPEGCGERYGECEPCPYWKKCNCTEQAPPQVDAYTDMDPDGGCGALIGKEVSDYLKEHPDTKVAEYKKPQTTKESES